MSEDDEEQVLSWTEPTDGHPQPAPSQVPVVDAADCSSGKDEVMDESGDSKLLLPPSQATHASTAKQHATASKLFENLPMCSSATLR